MDLFYAEELRKYKIVGLKDDQLKHAVKALRKREGDTIYLTDGRGTKASGELIDIGKHRADVRVETIEEVPPPHTSICVGLAFTKNIKRIEWAVEKMTEMGIHAVYPLLVKRSERVKYNHERLQKIAISAIKQSQQYYLPIIHEPCTLEQLNGMLPMTLDRLIAHKSDGTSSLRHNYVAHNNVIILIGPEGDFTDEEVSWAESNGFKPVTLGETRLRTETAAVAAVAYIHALNG